MRFLKGAVIFLLGAGVGASGSYVYFKKMYNEKKEELDELRNHYLDKLNSKEDLSKVEKIITDNAYISYDKLSEEGIKTVIDNVQLRSVINDRPPEDYPSEPIVITEEDYSERELYFDKIEADYYIDDGSLVGEDEDLIEIGDTIGYENLEKFIADESEDVMYIRNASSGSDYMVKKVFGKYSELVGVGGDSDDD